MQRNDSMDGFNPHRSNNQMSGVNAIQLRRAVNLKADIKIHAATSGY
jgi:hypothetical protein